MRRGALVVTALLLLALACRGTLLTHFNHRVHLADRVCGDRPDNQCLSCPSCHKPTDSSSDHFARPQVKECSSCHRDAEAKLEVSRRGPLATPPDAKRIIFSHKEHLRRPELNGQCVKCHAGAVAGASGRPVFPPMATCLTCHEHQAAFDRGECISCHKREDLRALRPASFLAHDQGWMKRHGDQARVQGALCSTCHAQAQCDSCHDSSRHLNPAQANPEQIDRSFMHRFDFVSRHALEAQAAPGSCATCHARTECDACHSSRGISASVKGAQSPHPPGWASGLISNAHGPAARRDIASCATCHDQGPASNCVTCHKVGAVGGTPHPPGWRSTDSLSAPQCAACHGGP